MDDADSEYMAPRRTQFAGNHEAQGFSVAPAPTAGPKLRFRNAATASASSNTCGYVSDPLEFLPSPFACANTQSCLTSDSWLGCGTGIFTKCYNGSAAICNMDSTPDARTRCCTDTESGRLPLCVDYIKKTTSGRDLTRKGCYRDVWAVNDTYTNQVFLVDHPSEITDAVFSSSITVTPASATVFSSSITVTPASATAFDDASPTYTSSISSPATTSSSSEQSHANTGAIVGGVIGGVAVITLVCVVVWLVLRRRKAARADDPSTMSNQPEASQPFIQPYEISPVSPGSQAKRLSQQKAQQRPNLISPVPQYSPGPYFSSSNRNSAVDLGRQGQ